MEGYKDITFCPYLECSDKKCFRRLTDKIIIKARAWWGGDNAPICQFAEKPECYEEDTNV